MAGGTFTESVTAMFTPEQKQWLNEQAKKRQASIGTVLRQIVAEAMENEAERLALSQLGRTA